MPQAQTGKTKSTPKVVRVNADDGNAVLYRNLGNGRRLPFIWGDTFTLASGTTEVVVSSGVSFNDHDVAEAVIQITPLSEPGAELDYFIDKNTTTNVVKLMVKAAASDDDCDFDVMFMLGVGYNFDSTHTNQVFWKDSSVTYTGS
jgi:hypothetical protein